MASIKVAQLCRLLLQFADVKLVVTSSAKHFIQEANLPEEVKPLLGVGIAWTLLQHALQGADRLHAALGCVEQWPHRYCALLCRTQLSDMPTSRYSTRTLILTITQSSIHLVSVPVTSFLSQWVLQCAHPAVSQDEAEWREWRAVGDPVLHIELRRWADVLVLAPLSANTLAKVAHGLCDNLLTCVVRAWDFAKPLLVGAGSRVREQGGGQEQGAGAGVEGRL